VVDAGGDDGVAGVDEVSFRFDQVAGGALAFLEEGGFEADALFADFEAFEGDGVLVAGEFEFAPGLADAGADVFFGEFEFAAGALFGDLGGAEVVAVGFLVEVEVDVELGGDVAAAGVDFEAASPLTL
jgi:hypothetical protein